MLIIGVDENGLGPLLGPLVTTGITLETARYAPKKHAKLGRSIGIDDSKATAGFGQMSSAEGLALAVVEASCGVVSRNVDELFAALLLDTPSALVRPCPERAKPQCWSVDIALPCFGGSLDEGRAALERLAKSGMRVARAKSAVACTGVLNTRLLRGQSRVEVDLELMERLVLDAHGHLAEELVAICGMVGGIRNYPDKMRHLTRYAVTAVPAKRGSLSYAVEGVGNVSFEIDADATHMPVALASMVGKYVRELWMARQNRFYQAHDSSLADVSGYHDPVTRRFIASTRELRVRLGVHDDCFVRKAGKSLVVDERQLSLIDA